MFVINFKLDLKKILLVCFIFALFVITIVEFGTTPQSSNVSSKTSVNYDYEFTDENFTKILKDVHSNIDSNIGKTVTILQFQRNFNKFTRLCRSVIHTDKSTFRFNKFS